MSGFLARVGIFVAVFGAVTGLAELLGASNLGVAISFGAIAATAALMGLIVGRAERVPGPTAAPERSPQPRRPPPPPPRRRR